MKKNIKKELNILKRKIQHHNYLYYEQNNPEISDYEYDMMMLKLKNLEEKYPELKTKDSPTATIGGNPSSSFDKVTHKIQMGSLQDAFNISELLQFDKRVREKIKDVSYVVEPKVDGLSVSLEYKNGIFTRGSTRGNGFVGENVTENLRTIKNIPKILTKKIPFLEVRAEVFMRTEDFLKIVKIQKKLNKPTFKNPRNAASGSLRQKNSIITSKRNLNAIAFNVQQIEGLKLKNHTNSIELLKQLGFQTIPESSICNNIQECIDEINKISKYKSKYEFEIDGAVIKINSLNNRKIMGANSKNPRWAIAFKYPPEEKQSILEKIEINVGRTGILTPVAIFTPIIISGSTVCRASLHNKDFISKKDIRIRDTISVRKAGEIIPEIVKSLKHEPDSVKFMFPSTCPVCHSSIVQTEDGVNAICENPACPATLEKNIVHFASKEAMDIEGLGNKNVKVLLENKIINDFSDLYYISKSDLLKLNNFAEKSATNLIQSIEKSKSNNLWQLLCGLGIKGIGKNTSKILSKNFNNIFELIDADINSISKIKGIGPTIATNIIKYFSMKYTIKIINKLKYSGVNLSTNENIKMSNHLDKITFAITGTLNTPRKKLIDLIESKGGKVASNVSSKIDYLILGKNAGSKLHKANKLNIKIIDEKSALDLIK